jgi:hypothetical protein
MSGDGCGGCRGSLIPDHRTLVIAAQEDLDLLLSTRGRFDAVVMQVDAPPDERTRWERRLLEAYADCGCDAGGVALLIALAAIAFVSFAMHATPSWRTGVTALFFCFGAAMLGKMAGLAVARLRLWRDIQQLSRLVPAARKAS